MMFLSRRWLLSASAGQWPINISQRPQAGRRAAPLRTACESRSSDSQLSVRAQSQADHNISSKSHASVCCRFFLSFTFDFHLSCSAIPLSGSALERLISVIHASRCQRSHIAAPQTWRARLAGRGLRCGIFRAELFIARHVAFFAQHTLIPIAFCRFVLLPALSLFWSALLTSTMFDRMRTLSVKAGETMARKRHATKQCPGPALCPLKTAHAPNGPEADCEFNIGCGVCQEKVHGVLAEKKKEEKINEEIESKAAAARRSRG